MRGKAAAKPGDLEAGESKADVLSSQTLAVDCHWEMTGHLLIRDSTDSNWTGVVVVYSCCTGPPKTAFCMYPRGSAVVWLVPSCCR